VASSRVTVDAAYGPFGKEALELVAEGLRNREIGERLFVMEKTVKNPISGILEKLHANDRTGAAMFGRGRRT
jgi:two-component system, NarL family, response regulator DevR